MKNIVKLFIVMFTLIIFTNCYDRDIIDRKDFNHTLSSVENLAVNQEGNSAIITWQFPNDISDNFRRPVEVSIQVVEDNIYRQKVTLFEEETRAEIVIDPTKEYRFVVKLVGFLVPDAREEGFTDRVFSDGNIAEL